MLKITINGNNANFKIKGNKLDVWVEAVALIAILITNISEQGENKEFEKIAFCKFLEKNVPEAFGLIDKVNSPKKETSESTEEMLEKAIADLGDTPEEIKLKKLGKAILNWGKEVTKVLEESENEK